MLHIIRFITHITWFICVTYSTLGNKALLNANNINGDNSFYATKQGTE